MDDTPMKAPNPSSTRYDVVVVGAGPNGLAAAVALARAGLTVRVVEAMSTAGGGSRSGELTQPGFVHDYCSAVHPLGVGSPFFATLELERFGLSWIESPVPLVHLLDDGTAVTLERSTASTAEQFGRDGAAYRELMDPIVERFDTLMRVALGPLRIPPDPLFFARFGWSALQSMSGLARRRFTEPRARALLAGIAAHAMVPLDELATSAFALVLGAAGHAVGWPIARGGSQAIADALVGCLRAHGGHLELGRRVERLSDLPRARAYVLDLTPRQLLHVAGDQLSGRYRARLARFRYGPGVYKMDWALRAPVPWIDPACARACTVHLAGDLDAIARAEAAVHEGRLAERPFVLFVQPSLFDPTRAPPGLHTAWAYCHVPHGSTVDASAAIEAQIERFAPGFKQLVFARSVRNAADMEAYNPNYVGGDINGGLSDLHQLFFRPVPKRDPYATSAPDVFVCSSSTPPGGGVHGMCGFWAAQSVLERVFGRVPARMPEDQRSMPHAAATSSR